MADTDNKELRATPQHQLKPRLEYIGRLLGMDVYVDTKMKSPQKRNLAEKTLKGLTQHQLSQKQLWTEELEAQIEALYDPSETDIAIRERHNEPSRVVYLDEAIKIIKESGVIV